jgi:hypothetical protein
MFTSSYTVTRNRAWRLARRPVPVDNGLFGQVGGAALDQVIYELVEEVAHAAVHDPRRLAESTAGRPRCGWAGRGRSAALFPRSGSCRPGSALLWKALSCLASAALHRSFAWTAPAPRHHKGSWKFSVLTRVRSISRCCHAHQLLADQLMWVQVRLGVELPATGRPARNGRTRASPGPSKSRCRNTSPGSGRTYLRHSGRFGTSSHAWVLVAVIALRFESLC